MGRLDRRRRADQFSRGSDAGMGNKSELYELVAIKTIDERRRGDG